MAGPPDAAAITAAVLADPGVTAARDQLAAARADDAAPPGTGDRAARFLIAQATLAALRAYETATGVRLSRADLDALAAVFEARRPPRAHDSGG